MLFRSRYTKLFEAETENDWAELFFVYARQIGFEFCLFGAVPDKKLALIYS